MTQPGTSWTIRPGGPEDSAALQELFAVVFGHDRGEEHHAWKFDRNPAGPPVLAVAEDAGRVVGQYALWPMRLRVGKEVVLGAQSLDTMTHPDYRGQGMFTRLAKEAMRYAEERGVEVLFGFPNAASYPGFVNKLDWDHTGDVPQYVRVLRPSGHARVPSWAGPVTDALAGALPRGPRAGIPTHSISPDAAALAQIWADALDGSGCAVERDAGYLQWRFDAASGKGYRWVSAGDRTPEAIAVWGRDPQSQRALLAELAGRTPEATAAALSAVIAEAREAGHTELGATGQRPGLAAMLYRAGFVRRSHLPLIVRKLTTRVVPANVHRHSGWSLFGADLDTF